MLFIVAGTVNISQMFATITSALTLTVAHSMNVKSLSPMKEGGDSSSVPDISMRCLQFQALSLAPVAILVLLAYHAYPRALFLKTSP